MNFWIALGLATTFLIAAVIILATNFLFPHHRILAITIYAIGWIPFLYSLFLKRQLILKYQETVSSFFSVFWIHILFGIVMLASLYVFLVLFPATKSPFIGLSNEEIAIRLNEDETIIQYLDEKLINLFEVAEKNNLFAIDFKNVSEEEKENLKAFWVSYLEALLELDLLKERYKTFYQLNAVTNSDLHKKAFRNGYAAFMSQHYYTLQLQKKTSSNSAVVKFLNEEIKDQGIEKDTYLKIKNKLTDPDELLRLNTGRAYNLILNNGNYPLKELITKYINEVDESIGLYSNLVADKPLSFLERNSFKLWFPIQKQSAIQVSYIRTTNREYHITAEQINQYRDNLNPGDILLERREWHATNVGIPGYWTHSALYIGTLDFLNKHFEDLSSLNGQSFSEFAKENYPEAYKQLLQNDESGYSYAVVESKRPGVILMSLEASTNADSLGVLRVKNLDLEKQFKVVTQALSHFGKPYDFDFDFITDNAMVCSELVYKAYQDIPELSIKQKELNGRLIVSPNQFAEKFKNELGSEFAELELVLFLDGNEKEQIAIEKGPDEFATTWERPKWHIANDFVSFE
jgi:hypothetical protein